jgi:hypothetical protein
MRHEVSWTLVPASKTLTDRSAYPLPSEDSSRRLIGDWRLTIVDFRFAKCQLLRRLPGSHFQIRGAPPQKMLNMKLDPETYMKTKDRLTQ